MGIFHLVTRAHTDQTRLNTTKSDVFSVLWHMKKQGYSGDTINFVRKALKVLEDGCGLNDPETLKAFIAEMDVADSYKRNLCYAYEHYLRLNDISWNRPKYYAREKLPKIPSEKTIDMIIAARADKVFDAIRDEKFYILTHPELKDDIRRRMEDILQERNPTLPA